MRGLNKLTNAANGLEHGPRKHDRRRAPKCADCQRACVYILDQNVYLSHCYQHLTDNEYQELRAYCARIKERAQC